ncbi:MAG: class I SAM-dependent methyltransferase [Candidatus Pacebacteria bacterium]|nr:class I SAM-dependent methyltransferase [Candidatus Paceibacterota bacterium]
MTNSSKPSKFPKPGVGTSWEHVAEWYDRLLEGDGAGTYQKELILPNLLRLMNLKKSDRVLDLACGQGFFAREFVKTASKVTGADASKALIARAKERERGIDWHVAMADSLPFLGAGSIDKAVIVLALQNIDDMGAVFRECARVIKPGGMLFFVLNHPAFRIPKASGWGWDEKEKVQYRRVDRYLSELKVPIDMHPGQKSGGGQTLSFHRPLQSYFKALGKAGFGVVGMEEWNSHKKSEPGPRAVAEDRARKEIPLFLCFVCRNIAVGGGLE